MAKNIVRLTESQLKNMIKESVKNVLREDVVDVRDYDREWEGSPEEDAAYEEWINMADKLNAKGGEIEKGGQLDSLIKNNPNMSKWYNKMRKKHETDYLWRKHDEFNEYPEWKKEEEMEDMWNQYGLPESKRMSKIIKESVKKVLKENAEGIQQVLNEIDVTELIRYGAVEIGDYEIVRLSDRLDAIIELQITNLETGKSAKILYASRDDEDITTEYYNAVEDVCSRYMRS